MSETTAEERASKWREVCDDISDLVFDLEQAEAQLAEAVRLGRNIVNKVRAMKGGDQAPLYEFSDFLAGLEKHED